MKNKYRIRVDHEYGVFVIEKKRRWWFGWKELGFTENYKIAYDYVNSLP